MMCKRGTMKLTFDAYSEDALATAVYPNKGNNAIYPALGLCGESGEVAEKLKKVIRDKEGVIDDDTRAALKKELGDVLWYVNALSGELGFTLAEVATANIEKLHSRRDRGKIHGEGDNR